jgi:hypothetical protein
MCAQADGAALPGMGLKKQFQRKIHLVGSEKFGDLFRHPARRLAFR